MFEQSHTEEDLHSFIEAEPSLIARGVASGEPVPTVVLASHLDLDVGELDLLFLDAEGETIIVELKRGRTSREVVGQILDYAANIQLLGLHGLTELEIEWEEAIEKLMQSGEAAEDLNLDRIKHGIQNPRLLIAAFEIDYSTKHIAEYLRSRGVPIYCIEFKYFIDKDFEYFYPEVIGDEDVRRLSAKEETPTQRAYRAIWKDLLEQIKEARPGITRSTSTKDCWMSIPIGINGAHLEWVIHRLNRQNGWFEVGLHFEHRERSKNKTAIEWTKEKRTELQSITGLDLEFEEEWGKRWARVYARHEAPIIDDKVKKWALESILRFYDAVEELKIIKELRNQGW